MKTKELISVIVVIGIVLAGLIYVSSSLSNPNNQKTIEVQGTYSLKKAPDTVWMVVGVDTQADTAQDAENQNTDITNSIYDSLKRLGLTSEDYKTESYNVYPNRNWQTGSNEIESYTVTHQIRIQTDKLDLAGEILDVAISSGANNIYGVTFDLNDNTKDQAKAEALEQATKQARDKAEGIAKGLGVTIKGVKSVSDNSYNYYPVAYDLAVGTVQEKGADAITTEPGTIDITATVSVVYGI